MGKHVTRADVVLDLYHRGYSVTEIAKELCWKGPRSEIRAIIEESGSDPDDSPSTGQVSET